VSYELASPEKALMLMAVQTSGQTRLDFTGAVKVVGIDDRIQLEITNPLTGEVTAGSVDPELLSMKSAMDPPKTGSGQRGKDYSGRVDLLTSGSPGMSILEAVDQWTAQNQTEDSIYSLEDDDLSPDDLMPYGDEPKAPVRRGR
jgi:DNA polymerase/3'-5' exonuclease PolX